MNLRKTGLTVLMVLLMGALLVSCSDSDKKKITGPEALPPEEIAEVVTESSYKISGKIIDDFSDPVASAKVRLISGEESSLTYTDANGSYVFSDINIGQYTVTSEKAGYSFTSTKASVTENGVLIKTMTLKSMAQIQNRTETETTATAIRTSGVVVKSEYQEEVSTGTGTTSKTQQVKASIPSATEVTIDGEAIEEEIIFSAAPMTADQIPQAEKDELPLSAVVLEPQGAEFSEPVTVTMPMGIQLPAGTKIPVKKLEDGVWVTSGEAEIGSEGANMDVTKFGQYSIQVKVQTETTEDPNPVTEVAAAIEVPDEQTSVELEATDTIEFSEPLPEGLSASYIQSLIEQQTGTSFGVAKSVSIASPTKTVKAQQAAKIAGEIHNTWTVQKTTSTSNNVFVYGIDLDGDGITDINMNIPYTTYVEVWAPVIQGTIVIWWVDVAVTTSTSISANEPITGATITFMNEGLGLLQNVTTGSEPYRFKGLHGQKYELLIAKDGYKFEPAQRNTGILTADKTISIKGVKEATYSQISGAVSGAAGVVLTLTSTDGIVSQTATVPKDGGRYSFNVLNGKSYTVSASKTGFTFNTAAAIPTLSANVTRDFQATQTTAAISGTLTGTGNVAVRLTGTGIDETVTVLKSGDAFTFTTRVPIGGAYTVTATKQGYTFTSVPALNTSLVAAGDVSMQINAYTAVSQVYIPVTFDAPLDAGNLRVELSCPNWGAAWAGGDSVRVKTVSPTKTVTFGPLISGRNFTLVATPPAGTELVEDTYEFTGLNYSPSVIFKALEYFTISGLLIDQFGVVIPGASITMSGDDSQSVVSEASGAYSFTVLKGGKYTVSASKDMYTFTPANREFASVTADKTQNFSGTQYVTISGTVTDSGTISGAVTVELSGGTQGTLTQTVASGGGSYLFTVKAGSTYRVIARKTGITFAANSAGDFVNIRTNQQHNFRIQHSSGTGGN